MYFHGRKYAVKHCSAGFTLIEMIGVMAVIAILASAIAPNVVNMAVRAKADKEVISLNTMAESLRQYIVDNKTIPTNAGEASIAIATNSNLPVSKIQKNERQFLRGYYIDPGFGFSAYDQNNGLGAAPTSPRIIMVSDMNKNAPTAPTTAAAFAAVWDQVSPAANLDEQANPSLKLVRLNLRSLFHRVVFNHETPLPAYEIEKNTKADFSGAVTERYILDSTRIDLYANGSASAELVQIIKSDLSFTYASGSWTQP
jgi:prepilin-type N-terminal cleavage/methylation domain-containing protein